MIPATQIPFARARNVTREISGLVRAPRRIPPSEAAGRYLRNNRGPWVPELAPEMVEPLDMLASREYTGIVFVGPARSSKTFSFILGGFCYVVCCNPSDMLIIQMSQDAARDFSRMEIDRVIRNSPEILARLSTRAKDDNTYDKFFRNGSSLKIGWPAISQLSSKTLQYVLVTDYDRPENRDDVDGEGTLWDQAFKRIETYMSRGKCVAESSPGEEITDANWKPGSAHEAPPVPGILALYNRGTRARRFWPCKHCGEFFQARPGVEAFTLPEFEELEQLVKRHDPMTLAEKFAFIYCPSCGGQHEMTDRKDMKAGGVWVHEGDRLEGGKVDRSGRRRSQIASYWLGGVAATYQRWDLMLLKYFQGIAGYVQTGDEQAMKGCVLTDFAAPYLSRIQAKRRTPEEYESRLDEKIARGIVPSWVRFLLAMVDVQAKSFRINVYGVGPEIELVPIDRFAVEISKRKEGDRGLSVDPAGFDEDWDLLIDEVVLKGYPVEGMPDDFRLVPHRVGIDSGGREGVTTRAYRFWRRCRDKALGQRVRLLKGDKLTNAARVRETWPDSRKKGNPRAAAAQGDVPVLMLNVNVIKDTVAADMARSVRGPGYVHLPKWLPPEYFQQMTAEVRNAKGVWENPKNKRNEDWDLHGYALGFCIHLGAEKPVFWKNPPDWAIELKQRVGRPTAAQSRIARLEKLGMEQSDG